jgi:hypothetical protein
VSCGGGAIRDVDEIKEETPENYGIVIFSVTFPDNGIQELPLYLDFIGEQGGSDELRLDEDEDYLFAFYVKEGFYRLTDLAGENNYPGITRAGSSKEKREVYTEKQWGFTVKPKTINYVGNINLKEFSAEEGLNTKFYVKMESFTFSAQIEVRKRMSDVAKAMEKYPYLKDMNYPLDVSLMQELSTENEKTVYMIAEKKEEVQKRGYGDYSWGMPVEIVKKKLEEEGKSVMVVSPEHLVDESGKNSSREFYFTQGQGEYGLERVEITFPTEAYDKTFASLLKEYGDFGKKQDKEVIWFTPYTKLTLRQKEEKSVLIYQAIELKKEETGGAQESFVK